MALGSFAGDFARQQTHGLLDSAEPPTAILTGGAQVTVGVLKALAERDITAGRDIGLVALDELDLLEIVQPAISVVSRDPKRMGAEAARLLLDAAAGQPPQTVLLADHVRTAIDAYRDLTRPDDCVDQTMRMSAPRSIAAFRSSTPTTTSPNRLVNPYDWLTEDGAIYTDYLGDYKLARADWPMDRLLREFYGSNVVKSVHVEAAWSGLRPSGRDPLPRRGDR